jgi:hypothetical protein
MNQLSLRNNLLKFKTFQKITDHFRGLYKTYLKIVKENPNITTCEWFGLGNTTRISTDYACPKISLDIGCGTCG